MSNHQQCANNMTVDNAKPNKYFENYVNHMMIKNRITFPHGGIFESRETRLSKTERPGHGIDGQF